MTPWHVVWDAEAEDQLARIWLNSTNRAAITAAQAQADRLLSDDPSVYGRYLSEGLYALDVPPLVLNFTMDATARSVEAMWARERR